MKKEKVLRKNSDMVMRVIEDETILLPIYSTSEEINCIYSLNKAASMVWNLIDGKKSLAAIKKRIMDKFDSTKEEVECEMDKLIKDLKEIKAVK